MLTAKEKSIKKLTQHYSNQIWLLENNRTWCGHTQKFRDMTPDEIEKVPHFINNNKIALQKAILNAQINE